MKTVQQEIREEQKAYLKGKSLKYKLSYFKEYYLKATLIGLAVLAGIISIIYTTTHQKDEVCSVIMVNSVGTPSEEAFGEYLGIDTAKERVFFDNTYYVTQDETNTSSYTSLEKLFAVIAAKGADAILADYDNMFSYCAGGLFGDLRDYFSEEELAALGDKVYYGQVEEDEGVLSDPIPIGIDVTDAPGLKDPLCFVNDKIFFAVIVNTEHPENAVSLYRYITQ